MLSHREAPHRRALDHVSDIDAETAPVSLNAAPTSWSLGSRENGRLAHSDRPAYRDTRFLLTLQPIKLHSHPTALDRLGIAAQHLELRLFAFAPEANVELVLIHAKVKDCEIRQPAGK